MDDVVEVAAPPKMIVKMPGFQEMLSDFNEYPAAAPDCKWRRRQGAASPGDAWIPLYL